MGNSKKERIVKALVTYEALFQVEREVEIDEEDFTAWLGREGGRGKVYGSHDDALLAWLNASDTEFHAEVLHDWKTSEPLPADFELQYCDPTAATESTDSEKP